MTDPLHCRLSIVVPIHNEEDSILELYRRLADVLDGIPGGEIVLVDDRSTDESWQRMRGLPHRGHTVRLVRLSRNFGHQMAITAGLDHAHGEAVVMLDGDLQDPPELIPALLEQWEAGYDVVYAVRTEREGETVFKRATASLFYRAIGRLAQVDIPAQAGDFRLLSRRAVDAMLAMPERARFLRGMSAWVGFRQVGVNYTRSARYAGETKYPLRKMLRFAADAVTSFSTAPLRLVSALGYLMVLFCFVYLVYTLFVRFATDTTVAGWTSVVVLVLLIGGIQLLSLGIVGQYIARIYDESKARPLYIIDEVVEPWRSGQVPGTVASET